MARRSNQEIAVTALVDTTNGTAVRGALTTAPTASRRPTAWRVSGIVAGVALFAFPQLGLVGTGTDEGDRIAAAGAGAMSDAAAKVGVQIQVGASLCFLGAVLLVVFGTGYARRLERRLPAGHLLVAATRLATSAALGGLVLVGGLKLAIRGALPDHGDHHMYVKDTVGGLVTYVEQLQYVPLWAFVPVLVGSAVVAFRDRVLPRWFGVVSTLFAVGAVVFLTVLGLPYFAGLAIPLWLIAAGLAGIRERTVQA
jgi:hypothetical protein